MLKLLERAIESAEQRLVVLAPQATVNDVFTHVDVDCRRHRKLVDDMQRMRGSVYLRDGAITREQLTADGRHQTPEDDKAWHLLTLGPEGEVTGCAWYLEHDKNVAARDLRVRHSPLARTIAWRDKLQQAVNGEIARAHREHLNYVEVGGWAVANINHGSAGLMLALAGYSLGRIRGGCLGMTTATVRHCSSTILRRIGGSELETEGTKIPSYYDPRYRCEMEIIRFDSRKPADKYGMLVERLRSTLTNVLVVARGVPTPVVTWNDVPTWMPSAMPVPAALAS